MLLQARRIREALALVAAEMKPGRVFPTHSRRPGMTPVALQACRLRRSGMSLDAIAKQVGLNRERVRQLVRDSEMVTIRDTPAWFYEKERYEEHPSWRAWAKSSAQRRNWR